MGYGQVLGKTAVKLLLIILPCHAFKLNIFWVTYNKVLKSFEGIGETRYTKRIICQDVRKAPLEEKKGYQTERNWVSLL